MQAEHREDFAGREKIRDGANTGNTGNLRFPVY
jgi:hypothetical protein